MNSSSRLSAALQWSGALRRKTSSDPDFGLWLEQVIEHPINSHTLRHWFDELRGDIPAGPAMSSADACIILRKLRQRVFYGLMVRDINADASLAEVITATTNLADLAVAQAYQSIANELAQVHGVPLDPETGLPQEMLMIAMGKLGGKELNVSSDIDLIMLYGEEGETTGRRKISHHEFYGRLTQRMMPVLSELDANGQVFRTDLRLRPDGNSGPLAWSLGALEHYLVAQGREWERYAWIKARVISATAFEGSRPADQKAQLKSLRTPFVYRKYFDFDALSALRQLRERIREDWQRRAQARTGVDAIHNIKLGDGGIREIEFIVQLTQLIRGGRMPSLQKRSLLGALKRQTIAGVMPADIADKLHDAYCFLRRVEHRLQYREDEQTHLLPADQALRTQLAQAMGMQAEHFEHTLAQHRQFVNQTFRNAFRLAGMGEADDAPATKTPAAPADLHDYVDSHLAEHAPALNQRLDILLDTHRIRKLPASSRKRLDRLLPAIVDAAAKTPEPETTAIRLLDLVEHIAQRSAYLALLAEYPETLARVARLVAASPWASQYLCQYPLLLDSLIEWHSLMTPLDLAEHAHHLHEELDACLLPDGRADIEQQMNLMRDLQRQLSFQLLAQDLAGTLTVEHLADQLSALADMLLNEAIYRVWPLVQPKGSPKGAALATPHFVIIAYGKLGGKELGYASDLDLVFLYDDPREDAAEIYTKLGRRMASWLSTMTSSGRLYDIDLRLRPDGDAGMLAVSVDAFTQYQHNHAWPWEHQAITRARFAAGDIQAGSRFEALRREILLIERNPDKLKSDVRNMRDKISAGHPNRSEEFDLKHDRGGMVDVEFVTQYLVLAHARQHPELLENLGNITLLRLAGEQDLIPPQLASEAGDAYRTYRRMQHSLRLQGAEKARVTPSLLASERACVRLLWDMVIGE